MFGTGLPDLPAKADPTMAIRITDDAMTLEIDYRVVAAARFSEHAAADGNGAWIVSTHPPGCLAARGERVLEQPVLA